MSEPPRTPLPDRVERSGLTLVRWQEDDAPALHRLILDNLDHLRPFMAWTAGEPRTPEEHHALIAGWTREWAAGGSLVVGIRQHDTWVGSAGLHRRGGPDELEIGYWVDHRHLRQGVATATGRALTDLAFTVPGIQVVSIVHDLANLASAAVPARLGFRRLADRDSLAPQGPAGTGRDGVWVTSRAEWAAAR
ncbi:GNAT family N-acetyltransferase [Nakamurella flavida]|uniref:GNAT family N-acetyltransferase n=1 Tax=Nakamurella flavida TaxID=363630 RepID=A0A938YMY0_9ACTN|nr:GNAT family N-acetyltransferase [Nakamurella flavida]MBM9477506.1 GNAT family N-acetyltransferase [Nakamurella flavida]MDP9777439.1 RimJ/RimL family protein N-acetyltransferase [Nakamurella flavida]